MSKHKSLPPPKSRQDLMFPTEFRGEQHFQATQGARVRSAQTTYEIQGFIGEGGSGVVYSALPAGTDSTVAIKFYIPLWSFLEGRTDSTELAIQTAEARREFDILRKIHHSNIVRILDHGVLDLQSLRRSKSGMSVSTQVQQLETLPFLVTEYIQDAHRIDEALAQDGLSVSDSVSILLRLLDALIYLHDSESILHTDISRNNVLVNWNRRIVKLIDFGLSKFIPPDDLDNDDFTHLRGAWQLFPVLPESHPLRQLKARGGPRHVLREHAFPRLDIFQFWKLFRDNCLATLMGKASPSDSEYLRFLADSFDDWKSIQGLTAAGSRAYVERLLPSYRYPYGVPDLATPYSADRVLPLANATMPLPATVEHLINTRAFRRLSLTRQLTTLEFVYPSATHTRAEHCLLACELTRRLLESLVRSAIGRSLMTDGFVKRSLAAALLHDINHFPLLHFFQELPDTAFEPNCDLFDLYCNGAISRDAPSIYKLCEDVFPERQLHDLLALTAAELAAKYPDCRELPLIKSIIDSGVDVDKVSYLLLDSANTGVMYGRGIDVETLIRGATVTTVNGRYHIGFAERSMAAAESVVLARYWNFRQVYWHHSNRAVIAIVSEVLRSCFCKRTDGRTPRYSLEGLLAETFGTTDREFIEALASKASLNPELAQLPLRDMFLNRQKAIFRRLYIVRSEQSEDSDLMKRLRGAWETGDLYTTVRERFVGALRKEFPDLFPIKNDREVVFDVPGRKFDSPEEIYIVSSEGIPEALRVLSTPVEAVSHRFNELTKRARVYIARECCKLKSKAQREELRPKIRELLLDSLKARTTVR